jgi:uncharacterized protein (TIGR02391 family)
MPPAEAIAKLQRQIDRIDALEQVPAGDPLLEAWKSTTINILNAAFGEPNGEMHRNTRTFASASSGLPLFVAAYGYGAPDDSEERKRLTLAKRRALLESFVEQLQDLTPPIAQMPAYPYAFHPEIERVSGRLFRDGHYKQAAFEGYVRVITAVREITGVDDDGDSLMNLAFGAEKRAPMIQVNQLRTQSELDEQKGFMFLYKGIVGLRNAKAHSNTLFNDPSRAHEYLALASLLMRILEISHVNTATAQSVK